MQFQSRLALFLSFIPLNFTLLASASWAYDRYVQPLPDYGEAGSPFAIMLLLGLGAFIIWAIALRLAERARNQSGVWTRDGLIATVLCGSVALFWGSLLALQVAVQLYRGRL